MNLQLQTAMHERGVSTVTLARLANVGQSTAWRALNGVGLPTAKNRLLIAQAVGKPVGELFPLKQ
jgi:transcriptional regulator with XRE-family HTH domain